MHKLSNIQWYLENFKIGEDDFIEILKCIWCFYIKSLIKGNGSVYTGFKYDKYISRTFLGTGGVFLFIRVVQVTHQRDDGGGGAISNTGGESGCMMIYFQEWHISRQNFNFVTIIYGQSHECL